MGKKLSVVFTILLFPAVLFYYETVLRFSTGRQFFQLGTLFLALACLILGVGAYLLVSVFTGKKLRAVAACVLALLLAIPFLVEYFVFKQFKLFYDLNTTFGGAADAVTGFTDEIYVLVVSWDGFAKIVLFLLPAVVIALLGRFTCVPAQTHWRSRVLAVAAAILAAVLSWVGIAGNQQLSLLTGSQYSFQKAVDTFGLLPGIGLDVRHLITGGEQGFEQVEFPIVTPAPATTPAPTQPQLTQPGETTAVPTTPEPTQPPVVYVPNALDIDFSGLTAKGRLGELNGYVSSLTPSMTNEFTGLFAGKNLILITAEAFCAPVIDPQRTPTLYRMATKGIQFTDYYQPSSAGTTGGEYQIVFGMLPTDSGMSFKDTAKNNNYFTIGSQLNRLGYWGRAYHNNDYKFYSRHKTHTKLGYSQGYVGFGNGMEEYVTDQWPKSDLEMFMGSLPDYIDNQPFNVYYMTVSGHSNYTRGGNCMTTKHWDRVKDLPYNNLVKGYLAAQMELEDSMTYLIAELEKAGIADDTVIVISGDHFPYGLDDSSSLRKMYNLAELYGYQVRTSLQRDRNALIIWSGCLEDMEPIVVDSPTSSLDILPTLSNLFGTRFDSRLFPGRDVFSDAPALVFNMSYDWKTDYGTYQDGKFTPASEDLQIPQGYVTGMCAVVRNKVRYCDSALTKDYFGYLYDQGQLPGEPDGEPDGE